MLALGVRARWVAARGFTPRAFHATCLRGKPVSLAYEQYLPEPTDRLVAERTKALVICHGLFGSKQNWRSLAKSMAKAFGVAIYTLDMRNHGSSPHCEEMTYSDMADDVKAFLQEQKLSNVALVGHSMGGKVAMTVALDPSLPENTLSHLVSVDMSPAEGAISPEFMEYIRCMIKIDEMNVTSRSEADKELQKIEPNLPVRQFLLTNLERDETGVMRFRIPVKVLLRALEHIGRFPYAPPKDASSSPERVWQGPTLFVKGEHSKYINRRNVPLCRAYFPAMEALVPV
ncbi:ribonuclease III [Malassezia nana]|uniref:Ribonuclease III n=1 Tax=Malassezia nana TaxID=180528 RepID=A0AAF0J389_9BASI|nr:ribonuclease III [Malassezia nana]